MAPPPLRLCTLLLAASFTASTITTTASKWAWPHRGDIRAVITLTPATLLAAGSGPVSARIQWRRRDANPEQKAVIVTDSAGAVLAGVSTPVLTLDHGVVTFTPAPPQASSANHTYFVYYMPYVQSGIGNVHLTWDKPNASTPDGPVVHTPAPHASSRHTPRHTPSESPSPTPLAPTHAWKELPQVPPSSIRLESRDAFHSIFPMGLPANVSELAALAAAHPAADGVWIFPESREFKVMMEDRVPFRWVENGPSTAFSADVRRGEFFWFQLGLYTTNALSAITLSELNLTSSGVGDGSSGVVLPVRCLNTMGSTSLGEDVSPTQRPARPGFTSFLVSAAAGTVKALWLGVEIPPTLAPGTVLHGAATLSTLGLAGTVGVGEREGGGGVGKSAGGGEGGDGGVPATSREVSVVLTVGAAAPVADGERFADLESYARLAWLDSKYAIDDEVVAPYTPLRVDPSPAAAAAAAGDTASDGTSGGTAAGGTTGGGFTVGLLNREVVIGADGLPGTITVTRPASAHGVIAERAITLLARPVAFELWKAGRRLAVTVKRAATVWQATPATVRWSSVVVAGPAVLTLNASIHMEGQCPIAAIVYLIVCILARRDSWIHAAAFLRLVQSTFQCARSRVQRSSSPGSSSSGTTSS